jgi:cell division septal protein FtsQ
MSRRDKKAKDEAAEPTGPDAVRLSAHPRARRSIRRVRAVTGLLVLLVVLVLSMRAGVPAFDAVARALVVAVVAHFLAWGVAVTAWRHLALAELELAREAHEARQRERREAAEARAAERAAAAQ